ncbi:MAG: hypothetical protein ACREYE_25515 [Gammaproteobacteria bacterium]
MIFNGHLIRHSEGNLCIDPFKPSEEVLEAITRLGVAQILLTNRNHTRAVNLVRRAAGQNGHPPRRGAPRPKPEGRDR